MIKANMKILLKAIFLLTTLTLAACDNTITKSFGGTMTVEVASDQKLVNCSWKSENSGSSLWLLTRARKQGEQPETYKYVEKSTFGVLEGTVVIQER